MSQQHSRPCCDSQDLSHLPSPLPLRSLLGHRRRFVSARSFFRRCLKFGRWRVFSKPVRGVLAHAGVCLRGSPSPGVLEAGLRQQEDEAGRTRGGCF